MTTWAVIPVKPLRLAKSRLSSVLSPEERQRFAEAMLRHVLKVTTNVSQITGTLVISRDTHALAVAREYGAKTIQESGAPELNTALMRATSVIASWRIDSMLILPADLPLIAPQDVKQMIAMGNQESPSIVIATDRDKDGTNALFVCPPGIIDYAYGEGSFRRHGMLARDAGATVQVYESDRMWQDIDHPEDIENYARMIQRGNYEDTLTLEKIYNPHQELE
jgi:2-phospho-L-lactate/phosphoenolpyruvate guanylyltransferase